MIVPPDLNQARVNKCLIALVNRKIVTKDNSTVGGKLYWLVASVAEVVFRARGPYYTIGKVRPPDSLFTGVVVVFFSSHPGLFYFNSIHVPLESNVGMRSPLYREKKKEQERYCSTHIWGRVCVCVM